MRYANNAMKATKRKAHASIYSAVTAQKSFHAGIKVVVLAPSNTLVVTFPA